MIWRDDDIGFETRLEVLEAVDDLFQRYRQRHTIAVMAYRFDERPDLVEFIKRRRMDVQLHCWQHNDLTKDRIARSALAAGVRVIERLFGKAPTVLYPPWNRSDAYVEETAAGLGMKVSTAKISLQQFIRAGGDVSESVVNFHHWHVPDALLVEPALRLVRKRDSISVGKAAA